MSGSHFRFDTFELDRENFQLRSSGQCVRLQKVPLELLLLLADREGQLVTRSEITERIWGKDVFLDADSAVNTAIRKVRLALGDDSDQPKYIETVPGKGYRFIAQIRPGFREIRSVEKDSVLCRPMIAVLPLEDFSDNTEDYFSEGMTEEILTHLGRLHPQLGVISRTSVMKYKGTRKSMRQIGRELGVAYALEGSVRRHAGRGRVSVQLIETLNQTHVWAESSEYLLHDIFTRGFWPEHPLGRPILGTPETVKNFNRDALRTRFGNWFAPDHLVVTAAGNVSYEQVLDLVQREFGNMKPAGIAESNAAPQTSAPIHLEAKRDLEQVHLCIGVPSVPLGHEHRFGIAVLNNLLGGGMSSRLFQNIREKQGLAYAVFSELTPYSDAGMMTVYAGTAKDTIGQVIDLTIQEFRSLKESPVAEEELRRSKNHLKGSLMLSLESTSSRMSNLARQELYFGRFYSLDEILAGIEAVTREELQSLAQQYFKPSQIAVTVLGPLNGFTLDRSRLAC